MERHPKQIHVRMSEEEISRAKGLAASLGMTLSDLIRLLVQLPAEKVAGGMPLAAIALTLPAGIGLCASAEMACHQKALFVWIASGLAFVVSAAQAIKADSNAANKPKMRL